MTGFVFLPKITNFASVIELERHIEILLLSNDCVIVPGFGGFTANHVPAKYDDRDCVFLPPLRTLGFNPRLDKNDFLLVQSYSEAYDISYPEACTRIESDINEIRQQLSNTGSYELNDIGILRLNDDGNIEFSPCEAGLLTPNLYGLGSFEMEYAGTQYSREKDNPDNGGVVTVNVNTSPLKGHLTDVPGQDENVVANGNSDSNDKVFHIKFSVVRNVCICLIAVIILFVLATPVNKNDAIRVCNIDNGIFQHLIGDGYDKIKNMQDVSLNTSVPQVEVSAITGLPEKVSVDTAGQQTKAEENYFCLVLASKVAKKNAESFVSQLVNQGFDQASVLSENKSIKVIYGRYKSLNEAYNSLNRLKNNKNFYDAWVYQVKN